MPDPRLPVDHPFALIRSRMQEKRIFEARFLYRQLGAEIEDRDKKAIERELTGLLAHVGQKQQQARLHTAEGRNDLAEQLYREIEQIAIDVPGVSEERKRLQGAEALIAKVAGKLPEARPAVGTPGPPPVFVVPEKTNPAVALRQRLQRVPRLWLVAFGIFLMVTLLLLFRGHRNEQAPPAVSPFDSSQTKQTISIRPLVDAPADISAQPDQKSDSAAPAAEEVASPSPPPAPGELQIQESSR